MEEIDKLRIEVASSFAAYDLNQISSLLDEEKLDSLYLRKNFLNQTQREKLSNLFLVKAHSLKITDTDTGKGSPIQKYLQYAVATYDSFRANQAFAHFLLWNGNKEQALTHFNKAVSKAKDEDSLTDTLSNIAELYLSSNRTIEAIKTYEKLISFISDEIIVPQSIQLVQLGEILNKIGALYRTLGDYLNSEHYFQNALQLINKSQLDLDYNFRVLLAQTLNNLGVINLLNSKNNDSKSFFMQARTLSQYLGNERHEIILKVTIIDNLGVLLISEGNFREAFDIFNEAVCLFNNIGFGILSDDQIIDFNFDILNNYSNLLLNTIDLKQLKSDYYYNLSKNIELISHVSSSGIKLQEDFLRLKTSVLRGLDNLEINKYNIRNVAIIAHIDHGKTTLVDKIIHASKIFRENQEFQDLILDNNDLERERGITIVSKNVSVRYGNTKINIIDTPGHADFGGEVERVLKMADGVILLVDAFEGPMPQTRYVLGKALALGLKPIVVVNKVDKENCRPDEVHEMVFELMFNLEATEDQLDFPTLYGSSKQGWMSEDWQKPTDNITPLLDAIIEHIPASKVEEGTSQMQITSLDYSSFVGKIAIGRVKRGSLKEGQSVMLCIADGSFKRNRIKELHVFEGLGKNKVTEVHSGELCAVTGIENFEIGDTIADAENPEALPRIAIDEPTMKMLFTINNSPFFGQEGKFVTSRHLRDRLIKETEKNLALKVQQGDTEDKFIVFGHGILHLSVLIETMRREGYELMVGQPEVILKEDENGEKLEPIESLVIDVPDETAGKVIELVTQRKGELFVMDARDGILHLEFEIPSRGLIGLRNNVLTATQGAAIMNHRFKEYKPFKGSIPGRINGSLISMGTGPAIAYSLDKLQDRGKFFVDPGEEIYTGMVVGEHNRQNDIVVNLQTSKKLTNMRALGFDDNTKIAPKIRFTLEEFMEYIQKDEYLEITPKSLRIRKIYLDENERKKRVLEKAKNSWGEWDENDELFN